jgi:hypothetical protein
MSSAEARRLLIRWTKALLQHEPWIRSVGVTCLQVDAKPFVMQFESAYAPPLKNKAGPRNQ